VNRSPVRHAAPRVEPTKGPSHARALHNHAVIRAIGMAVTAVLAFVSVGGATAAVTLTGNISSVDAEKALGEDRPEKVVPDDPNAGQPLNILILGSDSRDGDNGSIVKDGEGGARSDTTMIMHISADRSRVELVSIPRDSTVDVPECPTSSGGTTAAQYGVKFNAAFSVGYSTGGDIESGALCVMKTIETLTDVFIDGFIVVDFAGFQEMINAVDGVELCIPEDVYAPKANHLRLDAGVQTLDGATALQYARVRYEIGDGSDLGRIGRQQEILASLARKVLGQNLLTDSPKLLRFLGAVTGSMTMSSNFASVQGLAGLAYSARNVRPDTIAFMTVPWAYDPNNKANVIWTGESDTVWDNMENDRPLSDAIQQPKKKKKKNTDTTETSSADPSAEPSESAATPEPEPSPTRTREAGTEAFAAADVTSVCG
jgi:LCP family protein required for cell wall assembly